MKRLLPPQWTLLVTCLLLTACLSDDSAAPTPSVVSPTARAVDLNILHVNDHHSRLDPEKTALSVKVADGSTAKITMELGGFARVKQAMDELTAGSTVPTVKLHAGDAITGDLYYTQNNGKADADLMNTICFDAFTLGNHEFDNGDAGLKNFLDALSAGSCKTPVLSANLNLQVGVSPLAPKSKTDYVKPYTIIERNGEKIGIIGLTIGQKTKSSSRPDATTSFADEATTAQKVIDELKAQNINKIILNTHLTYQGDLALAAKLKGVDVIIGGDSHSLLGPESLKTYGLSPVGQYPTIVKDQSGKTVCIGQAWQYSYVVGQLKVSFDANGDVISCSGTPWVLVGDSFTDSTGKAVTDTNRAAILADITNSGVLRVTGLSSLAQAVLKPYQEAKAKIATSLTGTKASENLCLRRVPGTILDPSRSSLGDACNKDPRVIANGGDIQQLVAQAYLEQGRRFGGADLALQNAGGVRTDIKQGDITLGHVYSLLPFKNVLVRLNMTGAQVKSALEDGIDFTVTPAPNGGTGAYPYAAGLQFNVDLNQPKGQRVSQLRIQNKAGQLVDLDLNANYQVIVNDFMANGGDGYTTLQSITARENTYLDYADAFVQYLKGKETIGRLPVSEYSTQQFIDIKK